MGFQGNLIIFGCKYQIGLFLLISILELLLTNLIKINYFKFFSETMLILLFLISSK